MESTCRKQACAPRVGHTAGTPAEAQSNIRTLGVPCGGRTAGGGVLCFLPHRAQLTPMSPLHHVAKLCSPTACRMAAPKAEPFFPVQIDVHKRKMCVWLLRSLFTIVNSYCHLGDFFLVIHIDWVPIMNEILLGLWGLLRNCPFKELITKLGGRQGIDTRTAAENPSLASVFRLLHSGKVFAYSKILCCSL